MDAERLCAYRHTFWDRNYYLELALPSRPVLKADSGDRSFLQETREGDAAHKEVRRIVRGVSLDSGGIASSQPYSRDEKNRLSPQTENHLSPQAEAAPEWVIKCIMNVDRFYWYVLFHLEDSLETRIALLSTIVPFPKRAGNNSRRR